jgi:hypothetical protein
MWRLTLGQQRCGDQSGGGQRGEPEGAPKSTEGGEESGAIEIAHEWLAVETLEMQSSSATDSLCLVTNLSSRVLIAPTGD